MKKYIFILVPLIFLFRLSYSQHPNRVVAQAVIVDGDTIPMIHLSEVTIFSPLVFKNKREARQFTRLVRYVKKVYPYAKIAGAKFNEYNTLLTQATTEKEKRRLMKQAEKDIKAEFEGELKKLTFSQGKILIKLIDRETQFTSYELVKELRGTVMATFWQGLARIFGYNLKVEYDPDGKDKQIELIVRMIEAGAL
ncbi:MAG: DUF4294 domain-containing protein [Saprospiraceae bacterium]|nr:DUF4294 domain-containing protein [Saprospiraceae bacterium]